MRIFNRLIGLFKQDQVSTNIDTSNTIKKSFNVSSKDGSKTDYTTKDSFNIYNGPVTIVKAEDKEPVDNPLIKIRNLEIKRLMDEGNSEGALEAYLKLQTDLVGESLSINDKFYILNGIYNCHINLASNDSIISPIKYRLESLYETTEYYKFLYLTAVRYFNNQELDKAIHYCDKANLINSDYKKSKILKIISQGIKGCIDFDKSISLLSEFEADFKDDSKELANLFFSKGDIAYSLKKYDEALKFYKQGNKIHRLIHYQLNIGMTHFFIATKETNDNGFITFDKVNFEELLEAVKVFEDILEQFKTNKNTFIFKRMIPYYLNALEIINEPQKVIDFTMKTEYIEGLNDEQIARMKAHAELRLGKNPMDMNENLSDVEKLKLEITWLIYKEKYEEVVKKVLPIIDSIFKDDDQILAFLLVSLSKTNEEEFLKLYKHYSSGEKEEVRFKLIWIQYLEHNQRIGEAKEILDTLLKNNSNHIIYNDAYRFYKRNNFEDEAFEITTNVMINKFSVLRSDLPGFIKAHFFTLIKYNDYDEVERFYKKIDFGILDNITKLQIEIEYLKVQGKILEVARKCVEYYDIADFPRVGLDGAIFYIRAGHYQEALDVLNELIENKNYKTSEVYMILAQLLILMTNFDKAYESAFKAKEIDKDNYRSISHNFFVSISLRCNRIDDSIKYMNEYYQEFPKNNWIKPVQIIKTNEEGKQVVDTTELDKILGDREAYSFFRQRFFNYEISISTYMHVLKDLKIDLIFNALRYRKKGIKIANGHLEQINKDVDIVGNQLLVDTLTLYVLFDSDTIDILDELEKVYVLYSTIEFLQHTLIANESKIIRKILDFIFSNKNIEIVPIQLKSIVSDYRISDEIGHCLGYSIDNKIPYLCTDFNLKDIKINKYQYIIDITALIRGLVRKNISEREKCSFINYKLMRSGYVFISFNAYDMLDVFNNLENYDNINERFFVYLSMSRYSDYESYIKVYNTFLILIEKKVDKITYHKFVKMIFEYLDRYLRKTQYFYKNLLDLTNTKIIKDPFFESNNIVNDFLNYSKYVEERKNIPFYKNLSEDFNYRKLDSIINAIVNGITYFFTRYKDKPKELEELCFLFKGWSKNIDKRFFDTFLDE